MKRKMILSCLICMAMLFLSMAGAAADTAPDYSWFAGPEKGTYTISDAADLLGLANIVNGTDGQTKYNFAGQAVELDAKIDLAGLEWTPIGMGSNWFCGEFDGNGYTISNMTITSTASTVHLGLFGRTTKAYIHDFVMENPSITATGSNIRAGAVAAYAGIPDKLDGWTVIEDVSISNVSIVLNGSGNMAGSVAGYVWKSQMGGVSVNNTKINCTGSGSYVGGMVGCSRGHVWDANVYTLQDHWLDDTIFTDAASNITYVLNSYYTNCYVEGADIDVSGGGYAGGFVSADTYNSHSNYFKNCTVADLDMDLTSGSYTAGGFMGSNSGTSSVPASSSDIFLNGFDGCAVYGAINGDTGTYGGFVGTVGGRASNISNASAEVDITCNGTAGGFAGSTAAYFTHLYTFDNCSAEGTVTGGAVAGGFLGEAGLGGDGDQIYAILTNCTFEGDVSAQKAGGLVGIVDPELPASNWSVVEGIGSLTLTDCIAKGAVTGSQYSGKIVGFVSNVPSADYKDGTKTEVTGSADVSQVTINAAQNNQSDRDGLYNGADTADTETIDFGSQITPPEAAPEPKFEYVGGSTYTGQAEGLAFRKTNAVYKQTHASAQVYRLSDSSAPQLLDTFDAYTCDMDLVEFESGSIVVKLKSAYLATLEDGTYLLAIDENRHDANNPVVSGAFVVKTTPDPAFEYLNGNTYTDQAEGLSFRKTNVEFDRTKASAQVYRYSDSAAPELLDTFNADSCDPKLVKFEGVGVGVTLRKAYLDTLENGSYLLLIDADRTDADNTEVAGEFIVNKPAPVPAYEAPATGDGSRLLLWAGAMIVAVIGMIAIGKKRAAAER